MEKSKQRNKKKLSLGIFLSLVIAAGLIVLLSLHRRSAEHDQASKRAAHSQAGQRVATVTVKKSENRRSILLIGETRPYFSVTLYARVSGYMDRLDADIGDVVKQGQLLAHVESPEQEQAYNSAKANAFNLRRVANRLVTLRKRQLVSQQQMEQAVSNAEVAEAELRTQAVIRDYQNIVAPFDGIISNRYVDPGSLLQNASSTQSASQPLFVLSQTDRLRVFVYVDQKDAPFVHVGDPVEIIVPNQAGESTQAKVAMIAGELDPKTRTLLTELILENINPEKKIVAGSFVQVQMTITTPPYFQLPVQALVMRNNEAFVPVVESDGKLKYTKIDLAKNDGENILIRSGVELNEKVAINVGDSLSQGQKVQSEQQAGEKAAHP
jgi:RND family efflux transporter MFP subunit